MNEILLNHKSMPVMVAGDYRVTAEDFLHVDRRVDFHDMIYVTEGAIYVTEEDVDYVIHPGEVLFLKAGCHHYGKTVIAAGTAWYYAHFYLEQGAGKANMTEKEKNTDDVYHDDGKKIRLSMEESIRMIPKKIVGITNSKLEEKLKYFIACFHSTDMQERWMANAALFQFLSECVFWGLEEEKPPVLSEKIAGYLMEHMQEPFHADVISEAFYLSYKYLAAVFKKDRDISMQQYHNQLRMQEACRLLHATRYSISEIAARLGFTDALYFSRCFHQVMHCSPKEYRRKLEY